MGRVRLFIFCLCAFLLGVAMAGFAPFLQALVFFLIALSCLFFLRKDLRLFLRLSAWVLCWFAIGMGRFFWTVPVFGPTDLAYYRAKHFFKIQGIISAEVDVRSDRQYLTLESRKILLKNWVPVHGKILIKTDRYPQFYYGDFLQVEGSLLAPPTFEKFSYADSLAKDDIYVLSVRPRLKKLGSHLGSSFWDLVFAIKKTLSDRINEIFSEPEASLVAGLLMGLRRTIPAEILDDFNRAGLTHVLAISGYNITLMITIFGLMLRFFSRRVRFFGMLGGILLFLLFTGFSASVIRAAWMGFFVILAVFSGRKSHGLLILLFSAGVMVFLNPRMLLSDLSFQLSFGATLGLVLAMPLLEGFFARLLPKSLPAFLVDELAVTTSAQIFTTPLILYYFGRFSLIAPLANILFLPLIPFIMLFSFAALVISFFLWPLAGLFTAVSWLLLKILIFGVHLFAHLPFASIAI